MDSTHILSEEKSKLIAHTFENGKVKVTFTGEEKIMFDGEHHEWVSNEWQYINKKDTMFVKSD
jgi:hypothetical protein